MTRPTVVREVNGTKAITIPKDIWVAGNFESGDILECQLNNDGSVTVTKERYESVQKSAKQ
jgi:antitoxin component of MazEF toxin-antitoxin module